MPIYGASVRVNRSFHEGSHLIEYKAVDDAGNFGRCRFTVTVNGKYKKYNTLYIGFT